MQQVDRVTLTTNLAEACDHGDLPKVVMLWQQTYGKYDVINYPDGEGVYPIHWAALKGHIAVCRFLISRGVDVNVLTNDEKKCTAIQWAAGAGHIRTVALLLESGADPMIADTFGYTAYEHAVQSGHTLVVHQMWARNKNSRELQHLDSANHALVHWAAYKKHLPCLRYLVEIHNQSVNVTDNVNRTPLHWAARQGNTEICKYLIERGCNQQVRDDEDYTAFKWAVEKGHPETAALLQGQARAEVPTTIKPDEWRTRAFLAAEPDQRKKFLIAFAVVTFHYFILSYYLPTVFNIAVAAFYLVVSPMDILYLLRLRAPSIEWRFSLFYGGKRHLGAVATFMCLFAMQFNEFFSSGLFTISMTTHPVMCTVCILAGTIAVIAAVVTSTTDPGFHDQKEALDMHSEVFTDVENGKFDALESGVFCKETFKRKPPRCYACPLLNGRQIKLYDHFAQYLDSAVGQNNHRAFLLFEVSYALFCVMLLGLMFHYIGPMAATETKDSSGGVLPWWDIRSFSLCRFFGSVFGFAFGAVVSAATATFQMSLSPHAQVWLLLYTAPAALSAIVSILMDGTLITLNVTHIEATEYKDIVVRKTKGSFSSIYNQGVRQNWVAFLTGTRR